MDSAPLAGALGSAASHAGSLVLPEEMTQQAHSVDPAEHAKIISDTTNSDKEIMAEVAACSTPCSPKRAAANLLEPLPVEDVGIVQEQLALPVEEPVRYSLLSTCDEMVPDAEGGTDRFNTFAVNWSLAPAFVSPQLGEENWADWSLSPDFVVASGTPSSSKQAANLLEPLPLDDFGTVREQPAGSAEAPVLYSPASTSDEMALNIEGATDQSSTFAVDWSLAPAFVSPQLGEENWADWHLSPDCVAPGACAELPHKPGRPPRLHGATVDESAGRVRSKTWLRWTADKLAGAASFCVSTSPWTPPKALPIAAPVASTAASPSTPAPPEAVPVAVRSSTVLRLENFDWGEPPPPREVLDATLFRELKNRALARATSLDCVVPLVAFGVAAQQDSQEEVRWRARMQRWDENVEAALARLAARAGDSSGEAPSASRLPQAETGSWVSSWLSNAWSCCATPRVEHETELLV